MQYVIYNFCKTQHSKRALPGNVNRIGLYAPCLLDREHITARTRLFFLRLAQLILYLIVNLFHEFIQRKYGGIGFAVQSVGNSLAFLFLEAKYD